MYFCFTLYVLATLYLLNQLGFWSSDLTKDTAVWFFGTAVILLLNIVGMKEKDNFLSKIIKENISWVLMLTFFIEFYTFSLVVELVMIPIVLLLVGMNAVSSYKVEYRPVKLFTDYILSFFGVFLVIHALLKFFTHYVEILTWDNLFSFLTPIFLTISIVPFLYFFALFITFESTFVRLNCTIAKRNPKLAREVKKKLLIAFTVKFSQLRKFIKEYNLDLLKFTSIDELNEMIVRFKQGNKKHGT